MIINPREIAMKILLDININKAYSNIEINKYLYKNMDSRDENLIRELVYGVLENLIYIDYIIKKASKIRFSKIHNTILEILRIGIYQLVFMDRIPTSAAVNESVNLAKEHGHKGTIGFVNGLLREVSRNKKKYLTIDTKDKSEEISIIYSHPKFLVDKWIDEFGLEFTEALCKANNSRPKLNIRVNTLKISKHSLINKLKEKAFQIEEGNYSEDCLIIENPYRINETDEYIQGLFTIQDESSMLVTQIMDPKENSKVLDLCSAPGGKATHIGQKMNNKGYIQSRDIHKHKLSLIKANADRLGIKIIETEVFNALTLDNSSFGKFDYCLLDAPCSGLGVIRRKPEIKLNKNENDIKLLAETQYGMISIAKNYIKVGGVLIYSTCTIMKEENIMVIQRFLKNNKNFSLVSIVDKINYRKNLDTLDKGYIQLFPNIHGTDGFFIAKLIKER